MFSIKALGFRVKSLGSRVLGAGFGIDGVGVHLLSVPSVPAAISEALKL